MVLGLALPIISLRQLYHSHTRAGFSLNAFGVASSSALYCFHSPSSPLNVGMPDSADTPAPVSMVMHLDDLIAFFNSFIASIAALAADNVVKYGIEFLIYVLKNFLKK